ncbi:hypothetical protein Ancab_028968 [Ancistrocladus abbreviatus]
MSISRECWQEVTSVNGKSNEELMGLWCLYREWLMRCGACPTIASHGFQALSIMPATPFLVPPTTTTVPLPIGLMSDPSTIGSPMLDRLINEVKLAEHINVRIEGDTANAKAKIDDLTAAEGGVDDHA